MLMLEKPVPSDVDAEESVLGSILVDKDAINVVRPILNVEDFYREKNGWLYDAFIAIDDRFEGIDYVTAANELARLDKLDAIGGVAYLTRLTAQVPTSVHAEDYARIVKRCAFSRRLISAAGQIAAIGYADDDCNASLSKAQEQLLALAGITGGEGPKPIKQILAEHRAEWEELLTQPGKIPGVSTGYNEIDKTIGGFERGCLYVLAARTSMGKCLGKGTRILMFDGQLKPVEALVHGDLLMGPDSRARRVLSVSTGRGEMYRVRQRLGGIEYRVNANHILSLKKSHTGGEGNRGEIRNIPIRAYLDGSGKFRARWKGYKVAVEFPEKTLPIDPYFLGLWLGDGDRNGSRVTSADTEVIEALQRMADACGKQLRAYTSENRCSSYSINSGRGGSPAVHKDSLHFKLRELGLIANKHIPELYLVNSRSNRLKLLAGLIDSDGHYTPLQNGPYEITQKNKLLAYQIKFLCDTLGLRTSIVEKNASIKDRQYSCKVYRVRFNGDLREAPIMVERKKSKAWTDFRDWHIRGITVEPDGVDDYFGFELDGDGLFLLEDMTVTHNTQMSANLALRVAMKGAGVVVFTPEMREFRWALRMILAEAKVNRYAMRLGEAQGDWRARADKAFDKIGKLPIWIDETAAITTGTIHARTAVLRARYPDVALLIFDYANLAGDDPNKEERIRVSNVSRRLQAMAKALAVAVLGVYQLNRGPESRDDKRPKLSDLRESGVIEETADAVFGLYRPAYYKKAGTKLSPEEENLLEFWVLKQRDGAAGGAIKLMFDVKTGFIGEAAKGVSDGR